MPLPQPTIPRQKMHLRQIRLEGWKREDGLWDIEAGLTDTKDHDCELHVGMRPAGEPIHKMLARVTIDGQFNIVDVCVVSDAVPYPGACENIAPDYRRLIGLNLARGFRRGVSELFGGVRGCSHITELLQSLPTAAIQSFAGEPGMRARMEQGTHKPFQLDHCHALETSSETVRRHYPRWYRNTSNPREENA